VEFLFSVALEYIGSMSMSKSLMMTIMAENIPCSKGAKFTFSLSLSKHSI
jgi:hypothetical protein